jgi:hypothetical protein
MTQFGIAPTAKVCDENEPLLNKSPRLSFTGSAVFLCLCFAFVAFDLRHCEADASPKMVRFELIAMPPTTQSDWSQFPPCGKLGIGEERGRIVWC